MSDFHPTDYVPIPVPEEKKQPFSETPEGLPGGEAADPPRMPGGPYSITTTRSRQRLSGSMNGCWYRPAAGSPASGAAGSTGGRPEISGPRSLSPRGVLLWCPPAPREAYALSWSLAGCLRPAFP